MTSIPIGESAFAGFGVIGRAPLAVLVWGLSLFVLTVLPLFAMVGLLAPGFEAIVQAGLTEDEPSVESIMALQAQMMAINPLMTIGGLVARVVLTCAVFRAVLSPQDSRFAYLRLGKTELLVGLVYICLVILLGALLFAGIGIGAIGAVAVGMGSQTAGIITAVVLGAVLIGLFAWVGLRLSMALPMTFAQNEFRLFESWTLTRGRVLSLLLLGLLVVVVILLIELVLAAIGGAAVLAFVAARPVDEGALTAFFSRPFAEWAADIAPWVLAGGLLISILAAGLQTVAIAPWAAAYRALAPQPAPAPENPA